MDFGVALQLDTTATNSVHEVVERSRIAHAAGLDRVWLAQLPTTEALSLAPIIGTAVPGLSVGTSVVTLHPRHPLPVAVQARIAQAATVGGFTLGLGLGAPALDRDTYGVDDRRRIGRLKEFLEVAAHVRDGGRVDHEGDLFTARSSAPPLAGGDGFRLLVAAMGPQSLAVAGRLADGILPNLAGPKVLRESIIPALAEAAERAGRPSPQVVALVPVVVTSEPDRVRALARERMAFYGDIPSYRAVLDREGLDHAADLALIGDESRVAEGLARFVEAGVTEFVFTQTDLGGPQDRLRTWEFAGAHPL